MSWLTKIGSIGKAVLTGAVAVAQVEKQFQPVLKNVVPSTVLVKTENVLAGIQEFESIAVRIEALARDKNLTGLEKMDDYLPLVSTAIKQAESAAGHVCVNPELQDRAIRGYAQASIDLFNSRKAPVSAV